MCGTITLQRSGAPLDPGTLSLVLLRKKLKSIVGQYRGKGLGPECGRTAEQPTAAQILKEKTKGAEEGQ